MKTIILALLFISSNAYSLCAPEGIAKRLGCEVIASQSSCMEDYGYGSAVKDAGACSPKNITASLKSTVPSGILGQVKSAADEIDAILTMVDRKGMGSDILNFRVLEVKTFNESHIEALFSKMSDLREKIYLLSISVDKVDSKLGKQSIIYAARYYSFMSRIHQIMASAAHSPDNTNHSLDFDHLKKFSLKIDKRIGLEILARMNLKARHLDSETLKLIVSEEEKQNFEFNVLQSPTSLLGYSKLVQFMSIREFLNNKWALTRMSTQTLDDPEVQYCGPKMLSFKPGPNNRMGSSDVSKELDNFDLYFTRFPKIIDNLVAASKKANIMTAEKSSSLVDRVFKGIPSISKRMIEEFNWLEDEVTSWKNDIASTLKQNEEKEWDLYAKTTLSVVVFPGDKLTPSSLVDRIVDDIFNLRKEAVIAQVDAMMNDLLPAEKSKLNLILSSALEERRSAFEAAMKPLISPVVEGIDNLSSFKNNNYIEKLAQTKEISTSALSAAYMQNHIEVNKLEKKLARIKLKLHDLEPKGPSELVEFFQAKLVKDQGLNYYVDKDENKRKIVTVFFQKVAEKFAKQTGSPTQKMLQAKLLEIANAQAAELRKQYPAPVVPVELNKFKYERPTIVADNTRLARPIINPYMKLSIEDEKVAPAPTKTAETKAPAPTHKADLNVKPGTNSTDSLRTSYNVLSMARFQPMVADNTRVRMNNAILPYKTKNLPKAKTYVVHIEELNRLGDNANFVTAFLSTMNLSGTSPSDSFLFRMVDQAVMADIRLAAAFNGSALIKLPLSRTHTEMRGLQSRTPHEVDVTDEKPALVRMALEAFTLNPDGTHVINDTKLVSIIQETIRTAIANSSNKVKTVCEADHSKPGSDNNYKTLFRSSTLIRQGILNNEALTEEVAARLNKLDDKLKQETRYWHESIQQDYIEPMMNVAMVLFIVSALVIPMLGSAGILAPGSVMMAMTMLDGIDLAITGASLYFRSVSTFYEIPAQVKFQKSMAYTQVDNFALTSWDDVKSAESSSKMAKTMLIAFTPLDALVGGQFYFSAKKLLGISGKQALRRAGIQARGFGMPTKTMLPRLSMKEMIKQRGLVKGVASKTVQEIKLLKYWAPRYQELAPSELTGALRKGLVAKTTRVTMDMVVNTGSANKILANEPWSLINDLKNSAKQIDDRLDVTRVIDDLGGDVGDKVIMTGSMTWKEFINKPTYSKFFMTPKTFIVAIKEGKVLSYLENWGDLMNKMNKLRGQFLNKRKQAIETLIAKLEDVQNLAAKDKDFLLTNNKANWMDHFQSLLSDVELKGLRDIVKTSQGPLRELKSVFKDHDRIMEGIVAFSTVQGKSISRMAASYAKATAQATDKEDIADFYVDMLDDHSADLGADDLLELRQQIEGEIL